jgi:hypothetical protein
MRLLINDKLTRYVETTSVRPRVCDPVSADFRKYITNIRRARLNFVQIDAVIYALKLHENHCTDLHEIQSCSTDIGNVLTKIG